MNTNWDEKYRDLKVDFSDPPRAWLTDHSQVLPVNGMVLETAFGLGANIPFLCQNGNRWIGIERSFEAIRYVHNCYPYARVLQADLSSYILPNKHFDLICNFYFLDISLYDQFFTAIKPGGTLIVETLTKKMLQWNPDMNPNRLLTPGFMLEFCKDWVILDYREGWIESEHGKEKAVESIVARKPVI
jgi:hypothetical protein